MTVITVLCDKQADTVVVTVTVDEGDGLMLRVTDCDGVTRTVLVITIVTVVGEA